MALNDHPCKDCVHFDRIIRGDDSKKTRHGWCAAKSKYPAVEQPGQIFPAGVKRVRPGERAVPFIVSRDQVVSNCAEFRPKK